jgi:hypothetical protein
MHKVLIVWDARHAPSQLIFFIDSFINACSDYDIESRFLSFSIDDFNNIDKCQYSMRALLNAVHLHKPDTLISMGSESNLLAKLIKPALKIPLICNNLPAEFEPSGKVRKHIDRLSKPFSVHCNWSYQFNQNNTHYLPPTQFETHSKSIAIVKSDPIGLVLSNIVQQQGIDYFYCNFDPAAPFADKRLLKAGLIIISTDADKQQILATYAASLGIPTLYIGNLWPLKHQSKQQSCYGNVTSIKDINLIREIRAWHNTSPEQKRDLAKYSQFKQSEQTGIRRFLDDLGFKHVINIRNTTLVQDNP